MPIPKSANGEMPFLDHLEELRWRIIYSAVAFLAAMGIGLVIVFKFDIISILEAPALPYMGGHKLIITHPADIFSILIQIAITIGVIIAAPVIGYQIWAFLSPALHSHEKKVVIPTLVAGGFLFLFGVGLSWFIVLPMTLKWFYGLVGTSVQPMYALAEYISFVTDLSLAFGIAFELPLLLVALSAFGILSAKTLSNMRKWAVLIIWIAAAVISPGDAVTVTFALAIPLYVLYELSVVVAYLIERKRRINREREASES
ncbi:MAG TPA: twin-arginine translocase subunit TatC [Gemmatimonadaceae bacterium]